MSHQRHQHTSDDDGVHRVVNYASGQPSSSTISFFSHQFRRVLMTIEAWGLNKHQNLTSAFIQFDVDQHQPPPSTPSRKCRQHHTHLNAKWNTVSNRRQRLTHFRTAHFCSTHQKIPFVIPILCFSSVQPERRLKKRIKKKIKLLGFLPSLYNPSIGGCQSIKGCSYSLLHDSRIKFQPKINLWKWSSGVRLKFRQTQSSEERNVSSVKSGRTNLALFRNKNEF